MHLINLEIDGIFQGNFVNLNDTLFFRGKQDRTSLSQNTSGATLPMIETFEESCRTNLYLRGYDSPS